MAGNPGDKYTIQILNGSKKKNSIQKAAGKATSSSGEDGAESGLISKSIVSRELRTIASNATAFTISTVGITTGNQISQQRMHAVVNSATKLVAYGTLAATGNIAGLALMATHDVLSFIERDVVFGLKNSVESESLALSRDRAGVAFNQSRLGAAR